MYILYIYVKMCDLVNMNGIDDPFYRYVVKRIKIKQETNKTIIINNDIISKQTGRPDDWIITYLGQSLGVSSNIEKKNQNKCSLTGKHDDKVLQEKYFDFVKKYVLCGKCGNPETVPIIIGKKKNQSIELSCRSCGGNTQLNGDDKFVKFMVLHPMKIENENKKINSTEINSTEINSTEINSTEINGIIKTENINNNLDDNSDNESDVNLDDI
jgi:translation initiation factor 5